MISHDWPALSFLDWEATCDTLHMWTQIVGKTRLALAPKENHWWNVTLYVTPSGLSTSPIPAKDKTFDVAFDFIAHKLWIRTSDGRDRGIPLGPRTVADFYGEYMECLRSLGIDVHIKTMPAEFDDAIPFDRDQRHGAYDAQRVESFRKILVNTDSVFKEFRSRFTGKCSPVHFFWGSFDLAVTRFSGKLCPLPPDTDAMTREAYSHEVISCGFWPGNRTFPHAAFYAYAKPAPPGIEKSKVLPEAAYWDNQLGEFILKYDDVRTSSSPERAILDFCQSTYEAGANLAGWDRQAFERRV